MSLGPGFILIKGDQLAHIDKILESFGYTKIRSYKADCFQEVHIATSEFTSGDCFGVGIYCGWTIIDDRYKCLLESDGSSEFPEWKKWSSILDTDIFIIKAFGYSTDYCFCLYEKGEIRRVFYRDTEVKINKGQPLPIELEIIRSVLQRDRSIEDPYCLFGESIIFMVMKGYTGIDEDELLKANDTVIKICDPFETPVIGFVYDEWMDEPARDSSVALYINGRLIEQKTINYGGFFFFDVPEGVEPSTSAGQNQIIASKEHRKGITALSKNNWLDLHRIYMKLP